MKKLITIILVLVMLVSILALPAAAANVQPRYPAYLCPECGGTTTRIQYVSGSGWLYRCDSCRYEFYR